MSDFVHNQGYIYPITNEEYEKLDEIYFDLEAKGFALTGFIGQKGFNRYLVFLTYHSYGKKHDNFGSSRPCTEIEIKRHIKKFQDVLCKEIDKNKLKYIEYCWYNCSECFDYYEEVEYKPMTLNEAIAHAKEVAASKCDECGKEHAQLADWLQKLAAFKDKTYISEDFLVRNGFEKREYDFLYCDDVEEISAQCIDKEMGVWHVSIGFLDHCENTESLNICTVGQLRMFLAICGLD
ncbi:MAG: hypothetical protein II453_07585, partial [Alphaproteobacteria bacterium]|nr:hypothetical protein [Alphaproteobacteria bacterium]